MLVPGLTEEELERVKWFSELGFDLTQSRALATARDSAGHHVTVHDVRKALERGCSIDAALSIFT